MGLLCPHRPQGSAAPAPRGRAPVPSSSSALFWCVRQHRSTSPAPAEPVRACVRACVSECVHAGGYSCPLCNTSTYRIKPRTAAGAGGSGPGSRWVHSIPGGPSSGGGGLLWGTGASRSRAAGCVRESLVLASKPVKRDSLSWDKNGNFCKFFFPSTGI